VDDPEPPAKPFLLRYARPAAATPTAYTYDPEREVNVVISADGRIRAAVEGPDAAILTKSQTVTEGED
jgi:putative ATP-grasp target RiPP